ncbi:MAG: hypothetical protein ACD_48C00486G0001 [uncultured bacterium]|nr:MAG: hypothetical protein ACD_48C00486G0001 [uncultured bacterium]
MDELDQQQEVLRHKTFLLMFRILLIFGIPAVLAYFAGGWLDKSYDMRPYGSLMALGVAIVTSWTITIRIYLKVDKEFRELRKKMDERDAAKKKTPYTDQE